MGDCVVRRAVFRTSDLPAKVRSRKSRKMHASFPLIPQGLLQKRRVRSDCMLTHAHELPRHHLTYIGMCAIKL